LVDPDWLKVREVWRIKKAGLLLHLHKGEMQDAN